MNCAFSVIILVYACARHAEAIRLFIFHFSLCRKISCSYITYTKLSQTIRKWHPKRSCLGTIQPTETFLKKVTIEDLGTPGVIVRDQIWWMPKFLNKLLHLGLLWCYKFRGLQILCITRNTKLKVLTKCGLFLHHLWWLLSRNFKAQVDF